MIHHSFSFSGPPNVEDCQGNITITGDYSPFEAGLVQASKELTVQGDSLVKFFGCESLQGFMTQSGKVFGLDDAMKTCELFTRAKDVTSCGPSADHLSVAIDGDSGKLFQWTASNPVVRPVRGSSIENVKFESLWAGKVHLLALASNGDLYSWGSGRHGQFGH